MSDPDGSWQTPYTATPGSSTPGPEVSPTEGIGELWTFFWLALACTAIIAVSGVATWLFVR